MLGELDGAVVFVGELDGEALFVGAAVIVGTIEIEGGTDGELLTEGCEDAVTVGPENRDKKETKEQ